MKKFLLNLSLTILLAVALVSTAFSQVTTSGLKGRIVDDKSKLIFTVADETTDIKEGSTAGKKSVPMSILQRDLWPITISQWGMKALMVLSGCGLSHPSA